jgi:hypothetical protein
MIDDLINALENLQDAKAEYKEAAKNCEYDRGYFLSREIEDIDKAKEELSSIFKSAVSAIVLEVINKKENVNE